MVVSESPNSVAERNTAVNSRRPDVYIEEQPAPSGNLRNDPVVVQVQRSRPKGLCELKSEIAWNGRALSLLRLADRSEVPSSATQNLTS